MSHLATEAFSHFAPIGLWYVSISCFTSTSEHMWQDLWFVGGKKRFLCVWVRRCVGSHLSACEKQLERERTRCYNTSCGNILRISILFQLRNTVFVTISKVDNSTNLIIFFSLPRTTQVLWEENVFSSLMLIWIFFIQWNSLRRFWRVVIKMK